MTRFPGLSGDLLTLVVDFAHDPTASLAPNVTYAAIGTGYEDRLLESPLNGTDWEHGSIAHDGSDATNGRSVSKNKKWLLRRGCLFITEYEKTHVVNPSAAMELRDVRSCMGDTLSYAVFRCDGLSDAIRIAFAIKGLQYCASYAIDDIQIRKTRRGRGVAIIDIDAESG